MDSDGGLGGDEARRRRRCHGERALPSETQTLGRCSSVAGSSSSLRFPTPLVEHLLSQCRDVTRQYVSRAAARSPGLLSTSLHGEQTRDNVGTVSSTRVRSATARQLKRRRSASGG